jgi:hypothetical protein
MFHKATLLGLVAVALLVPLAYTPKALGQQVIAVRDPQTGRRYVVDLSAHPRLQQEGQAISAELTRLQSRSSAIKANSDALAGYYRSLFGLKADLARLERRLSRTPQTIVDSSGDAATGTLSFRTRTNPELVNLRSQISNASAKIARVEEGVRAFGDQVALDRSRFNADFAAVSQRLDRWSAEVVALPGVKGQ